MRGRANPHSAFSTPTSGGQEDHVSMGATACWNLIETCNHLSEVLACELLIACEALNTELQNRANHVNGLYKMVRKICKPLDGDRSTSNEIEEIAMNLRDGGWLARIEAEFGRLSR